MLYNLQLWQLIADNHFFCLPADDIHKCQPSRFRQDSPEFGCYVPLFLFTNLLSHFLSSAVSAVQQLVQLDI